jgi:hypothetical protein
MKNIFILYVFNTIRLFFNTMFSQILSSLTLIKSRMQIKMDRGSTLWWWRQGLRTRPSKWGWTLGIFLVRRRHGTKVNYSNGVPPLLQTETDVVRRNAGSRMEHVCRELHGGWRWKSGVLPSRPVHMEKWQNRAVESSSRLAMNEVLAVPAKRNEDVNCFLGLARCTVTCM